jgi:[citrate (pro-3S)-lyase] ligase
MLNLIFLFSELMPIYKNWQDFDAMRDKRKVLIIYGAGASGCELLNFGNIIPDYFCDKNANLIKNVEYNAGNEIIPIECLTLEKLLAKLNECDSDVLVSNTKEEDIKNLQKVFDKTKFTKNTVIYFYHLYNIIDRKFTNIKNLTYEINGKFMNNIGLQSLNTIKYTDDYIGKKFDMLKNAYFYDKSLTLEELKIRFKKDIEFSISIVNKRLFFKFSDTHNFIENKKIFSKKQLIYIFGDSRFLSTRSKREYKLDFMLSSLLNKDENIYYEIQNYSVPRNKYAMIGQLIAEPLIRNSIVIIGNSASYYFDAYSFALAKQYCQIYNCKLICYFIPNILSRKYLSDYEKFFIEKNSLLFSQEYRHCGDETLSKEQKSVLNAMDINFYEPPSSFFYSDKVIYLDYWHFGDYGNEIIAKHLYDIILNKAKPDNLYDFFSIELEKKIEYAYNLISLAVPDIRVYLNNLKNHKQVTHNNGSIVMNCNPFTLGHRYLIEYAATNVEHLYIFVVEENKSEFSFTDRYELIKKNTKDLKNVTVLPSGKFIISSITFDSYFGKSQITEERAAEQDVSFDLLIFAVAIAPILNITKRFVGQEPFDHVTRHYNEEMKQILPEYGCKVIEIPRLEENGSAVSASRVRKLLKEGNFEEIKKIVPKATLNYLKQIFLKAIRG